MSENSPCGELLALTTEIASAYIGNNVVEAGVPALLQSVFEKAGPAWVGRTGPG